MNLQPLFSQPIVEQTQFPEVHPGHASTVWSVKTERGEFVARMSNMKAVPEEDFWWGCHSLFGVDPTDVFALGPLNALLGKLSHLPVPQVLNQGEIHGHPIVVVEKMPGKVVRDFRCLPLDALRDYGRMMAKIHTPAYFECGHPVRPFRYPVSEFNTRLIGAIQELTCRFYTGQSDVEAWLPEICQMAEQLPPPIHASLIMLDMDPTQYLADGDRLTALIDTEVYALGPRELDLVALEYLLDDRAAAAFQAGYEEELPFPDLQSVRTVYRFLNCLMAVQGHIDVTQWMNHPALFI